MTDLYNVSGDNLTDAVCSGGGGVEGVGVVVVGGDLRFSVKRPPHPPPLPLVELDSAQQAGRMRRVRRLCERGEIYDYISKSSAL